MLQPFVNLVTNVTLALAFDLPTHYDTNYYLYNIITAVFVYSKLDRVSYPAQRIGYIHMAAYISLDIPHT